jgi:hypothetical protein
MKAGLFAGVLGAMLIGTVNNLTAAGTQQLFSCGGPGGCRGNVITVNAEGGDATAHGGNANASASADSRSQAGAQSSSNVTTTGGGGCPSSGVCPSGQPTH